MTSYVQVVSVASENPVNQAPAVGLPGSEAEFTFSVSSDNDDAAASSGSLSSKPSIGSLRAAANGAIGSERKDKSRERSSVDSTGDCSATGLSSDEGSRCWWEIYRSRVYLAQDAYARTEQR